MRHPQEIQEHPLHYENQETKEMVLKHIVLTYDLMPGVLRIHNDVHARNVERIYKAPDVELMDT